MISLYLYDLSLICFWHMKDKTTYVLPLYVTRISSVASLLNGNLLLLTRICPYAGLRGNTGSLSVHGVLCGVPRNRSRTSVRVSVTYRCALWRVKRTVVHQEKNGSTGADGVSTHRLRAWVRISGSVLVFSLPFSPHFRLVV